MTTAAAFPLPERQRVSAHWDGANATDLPTTYGTPWVAVFDGTTRAYTSGTAGNALYLDSDDGTLTAYYGHGRSDPDDRVIGRVTAGQTIGHVGMTGYTTGPHLHFALTTTGVVNYAGGGDVSPAEWLGDAPVNVTPPAGPAYGEAPTGDVGEVVAPVLPAPIVTTWTQAVATLPPPARPLVPVVAIAGAALLVAWLLD